MKPVNSIENVSEYLNLVSKIRATGKTAMNVVIVVDTIVIAVVLILINIQFISISFVIFD